MQPTLILRVSSQSGSLTLVTGQSLLRRAALLRSFLNLETRHFPIIFTVPSRNISTINQSINSSIHPSIAHHTNTNQNGVPSSAPQTQQTPRLPGNFRFPPLRLQRRPILPPRARHLHHPLSHTFRPFPRQNHISLPPVLSTSYIRHLPESLPARDISREEVVVLHHRRLLFYSYATGL